MNGTDMRDSTIGTVFNIGQIRQAQFIVPKEFVYELKKIIRADSLEELTHENLPRKGWEPETVFIPAGEFVMGSEAAKGYPDFETPEFRFYLPKYRIGKYPVTNQEYSRFVDETDCGYNPLLAWTGGQRPGSEQMKHPVKGITFFDAIDYCFWLIEKTKRPYTLPSESQWEKAARGESGIMFPWGDDWNDGKFCNTKSSITKAVNAYAEGASPFGCLDMVGNIKEWTTTLWGRYRSRNPRESSLYENYRDQPWEADFGREYIRAHRQMRRITRGGAALLPGSELRSARRSSELPFSRGLANSRVGFRVAMILEE